jgi:hypothetical protein
VIGSFSPFFIMGCSPSKHSTHTHSRAESSNNIIVKQVSVAQVSVLETQKPAQTTEFDLEATLTLKPEKENERIVKDKITAVPLNMSIQCIPTEDYEEASRGSVSIENQTILASELEEKV